MDDDRAALAAGIRLAVARMPGTKLDKCAALAVSPYSLEKWAKGAAEPTPANLARLSRKSGLDVETIRNGGRPVDGADEVGAAA